MIEILKNFSLLLLLILLQTADCFAQSSIDTLEYKITIQPLNRIFTNFDKQLNTYYLNSGFELSGTTDPFSFSIKENFRSTLVKAGSSSIRDEQYFTFRGNYKFNRGLNAGLSVKSNLLSDDRQLAINQTAINHATLFTEIELLQQIYFTPYGGYSINKQVASTDRGAIYGFEGLINDLDFTDFSLRSELKFENEDISPRKNLLRYFNLLVTNPFNPNVVNSFNTKFTQSRKDFYFPADSITSSQFNITNNIEGRTESIYLIQDRLVYNDFLNLFTLEISGRLNWRTIDRDTRYRSLDNQSQNIFDTNIEELRIGAESSLRYRTENIDGALRLNFIERDEKHIAKRLEGVDESFYERRKELESRKNNNSGRATISLFGNIQISNTDRLAVSIYHSKLKYDTPNINNDDDRDELLSIARIRYSKFISPFFEMFANVEGTYSHIVYLFASRSANNNINRVLRFSTGGYYHGAQFSSLNNFEVSANYTVYDYEDVASNLRSISFRQFTATDSTRWNLSKKFALIINGYIKITDRGDLNWDDFAERPTRYLEEIFATPKIGYVMNNALFALGIRYFSLNTFNYDVKERIPDTKFLTVGPLLEIVIGSPSLYLKVNSWYEFISVNDVPDRERANLIVEMSWKF